MGFANNVIPSVSCPDCGGSYLLLGSCPHCGLSHGQAKVKNDPNLCLCDAEQCTPSLGSPYNVIHNLRDTCPEGRGL